jgi:plasmid stabilization system protein ParE
MEKGITAIIAVLVLVVGGVVGVNMLPADNVDTSDLDLQIAELKDQIAQLKADDVADELKAEYEQMIADLQTQIDNLEDELDDVQEFPYMITKRYETELNESFSAWGPCGCAEHHIKDKALQRADDFAENLEAQNDNVEFISVKYMGLNREFLGNDSICYVTYNYDVEWTEFEYEDIWIYR